MMSSETFVRILEATEELSPAPTLFFGDWASPSRTPTSSR